MIKYFPFIFLFVSSSVLSSDLIKVTFIQSYYDFSSCITVGDVITKTALTSGCIGKPIYKHGTFKGNVTSISWETWQPQIAVRWGAGNNWGNIGNGSIVASCPDGTELNQETGKCEENKCKAFSGDKVQVWWPDSFGSDLSGSYMCASNGCITQIYTSQGCIDGTCTGDSEYNGTECVNPDVSGPCSDNSCTDAAEPPKPPTPEPDPDPEHKPDDPTAPIPDPNPLPPIDVKPPTTEDVDPEPEVTDPTPTPDSNGDIVKAITNMNKDVNKALNNLNVDINKSNADQKNELEKITGNVEQTNDQLNDLRQENIDIYKNTKALIQQANADITTGTNRTTNAVNSLKESLDVGKFGEPSGKVIDLIFSEEALTAIQTEIETKTTELESFAEQAKDLIHISTNFEAGSLSDSSFEVGGVEVKSGLYRFEGVSGQVRPVILFVCALISVWVLFGSRGK